MYIGIKEKNRYVENRGIWKKFFKVLVHAKIPWIGIVIYLIANTVLIWLALKMPVVQGNFFAGDASIPTVLTVIVISIVTEILSTGVLLVKDIVSARIDRNFRNSLWKKILNLEPKFFDQVSSNTLLSRMTNDAESLKTFVMDIVLAEIISFSTAFATIVAMTSMNKNLAIIMAIMIPVILLIAFIMGRLNLRIGNLVKLRMSELTDYLSGQLARVKVIKSYNSQDNETVRGEYLIEDYYKSEVKARLIDILKSFIDTFVGITPMVALIIIGINLLDSHQLTVAGWVAFYAYAMSLIDFFKDKSGVWVQIKQVQGQLNRILHLHAEPEEGMMAYLYSEVESKELIFDKVVFSYSGKKVLDNVSVQFPYRKLTAIVGASGTGKTTLVKLIERIYEPDEGCIWVGNQKISECKLDAWRRTIAFVSQNIPMISGTIRENILYGIKETISDEEILKAAKKIKADKFILEREGGLDSEVGQFGEKLSGGQRQKISILRAFLQDREYIILDEPTASLDMAAAYEIVASIDELRKYKTIIMVVHDIELIRNAEHILVVEEQGKVIEGKYETLLEQSKFFNTMAHGVKEDTDETDN